MTDEKVGTRQPLTFRIRYYIKSLVTAFREGWYRGVRVPFDQLVWTLWVHKLGVPLKSLSRRSAFRAFDQETRLWINPRSLERIVSVKEAGFPKRDFISDSDWDGRDSDIEENERFRMLSDLWAHRSELKSSQTFRDYRARADAGKPVHTIKKSIYLDTDEAILDYLEEQLALLDSISEKGVIEGTTKDDIKVAVNRYGQLIKANGGRKRTSAAIIVGAPALPVRVCHIHEHFLADFLKSSQRRDEAIRTALSDVRSRYGVEI